MKSTDRKYNREGHGARRRRIALPLLLSAMIGGSLPAGAQLHGEVTVEGDYQPEVILPERINMLPGMQRFRSESGALPYADRGVVTPFKTAHLPLPPTAWGADREPSDRRGYLDVSLGSWLNADISAGYRALRGRTGDLSVWLQHTSTSLWRPWPDSKERRYSYQETLGARYNLAVGDAGIFSVALQYHLGLFNYYGLLPGNDADGFPHQTLNDAAIRLAWDAPRRESDGSDYGVAARFRAFAFREGQREYDTQLSGRYSMAWSGGSRIGADASLSILAYGNSEGVARPDTYGMLRLTPYYTFTKRNMTLRLGIDLDFTANAGGSTADTHYAAFHAAPDVRFDVRGRGVGFFVRALGGSELRTLASAWQTDRYCLPWLSNTQPEYTPIDATAGFEITALRGLTASLSVRFKSTRHVALEGWHMALLNYGDRPTPSLEATLPKGAKPGYGTELWGATITGVGFDLGLGYRLGDIFNISASGSYVPQKGTRGIFNGYDRPRWTADASLEVHPVKPLTLAVDYRYRGVREIYTSYQPQPTNPDIVVDGTPKRQLAGQRLPDISTLDFRARWRLNKMTGIGLQACNLLNRHEMLLPCLRSEGITFAGQIDFQF